MPTQTIVVFSTKGGVGKTLIAANLAVCLAKEHKKKTCLMDLDLQTVGDMSRMLDLKPPRSMVDLIFALENNPAAVRKEDYLVRAYLNLDFLTGILKLQQSSSLEAEGVREVFDFLKPDYDYIIVDAGKSFSEVLIATLHQANLILLVVTPDILSVYQAKDVLDTLQSLLFPLMMIKVVLNRAESASSISSQEIKATLPLDTIADIPSDGKVAGLAVNRSIPLVIDSPHSKIAKEIKKFTQKLVSDKNLFVESRKIDQLLLKQVSVEKAGTLWEREDFTRVSEGLESPERPDEIILLKRRIHNRLIEELNLKRQDLKLFKDGRNVGELRNKAEMMITNFLAEESGSFIGQPDVRKRIVKEILDEALGLGALEDLLADPTLTDIMVNNKDEVYIEREGKIQPTHRKFISNEQVKTIIERIIAPIGRHIDESAPMVDARLPDGSRVNAIIPPLSLTGPCLTIRKFRKERLKMQDLIALQTLSDNMKELIMASVLCRKNIIISGGTGSGKTTVLNVLSAFIPNSERIITIEDAAELKLHQEHWIRLESRPPNIEGKGSISIRDLFRNTLRMRPDRIIIGECRSIEALDMLQAMNTGHDGSMTTIHANSTHDVLTRLDSMILMSGVELPIRAIREMIASAIDIIIHTARLSDGSRKVVEITEIVGMKDEMHINLQDIFFFKQTGVDTQGKVIGDFVATGYTPSFVDEIKIKGISLPENIFQAPVA